MDIEKAQSDAKKIIKKKFYPNRDSTLNLAEAYMDLLAYCDMQDKKVDKIRKIANEL